MPLAYAVALIVVLVVAVAVTLVLLRSSRPTRGGASRETPRRGSGFGSGTD